MDLKGDYLMNSIRWNWIFLAINIVGVLVNGSLALFNGWEWLIAMSVNMYGTYVCAGNLVRLAKEPIKDRIEVVRISGCVFYFKNGLFHREDGPAVKNSDGSEEWHVDGEPHRLDGPAVTWSDGTKEWYVKGQLHRFDGPAIEFPSGTKVWYVFGVNCTEDGYYQKLRNLS